jgi:hypothetical protein
MTITASVTFVVAAVVTYLYNYLVHGNGIINWETAVDMAIILGIILPLSQTRSDKSSLN